MKTVIKKSIAAIVLWFVLPTLGMGIAGAITGSWDKSCIVFTIILRVEYVILALAGVTMLCLSVFIEDEETKN